LNRSRQWNVRVALLALPMLAGAAGTHELRFCLAGDPKTFDPLHVSDQNSDVIRYLTGGVLVRVDRVKDQPQPELAEKWEIGDGGRAITFHLRAGLQFSDGTPLTAADVVRTFNTALDPKESSPAGDPFRSTGSVDVRVISPRELTIRYASPKPDIERLFDQLPIIPPRLSSGNAGKLPASAGPFYVAEYKAAEFVRLARNPRYWKRDAAGKQLPYLDSIRIEVQPNRDIELTRFLRGETHLIVARMNPENFDRVAKEKPAAARNLGASFDSEFLWFNQAPSATVPQWKRKWFTSATFRHAISASIQRDDIVRIVFRGHAHPGIGPFSPSNKFWFNASLKPLPFDPKAALASLAKEGFALRDGVLRDRDGHAVEFSIVTNPNRTREAMAAIVQDDLRRIGVRVNVATLDFAALIERLNKTFDYEACLLGLVNVEADPMEQMNFWLSSGDQHQWWPRQKTPATPWEARIDQLELLQASEPSRALRKKAVDEVQRIAAEEEPILYLVNPDYLAAISPALRGVEPVTAPPQILWNAEWLRLE
jgi:peptide/nickel transport system substrate-binding protein